ncbi:MAG: MunI family type II restriction endonuclease, partial [Flammeovirgaceae bacterium]
MGSKANRTRKKWQDYSGRNAGAAEQDFYTVFFEAFKNTSYQIRPKPNELNNIYVGVKLSKKEQAEIYTPNDEITRHGVFPDYAIDNVANNKTLYIEVKRQDGWVEGGVRSDGRGNAHERSCKFFTLGLLKILR